MWFILALIDGFGLSLHSQGGITCEAIDEPGKSSKAIDKRVIINFCDKNVVIARFCDQNKVFVLFIDMTQLLLLGKFEYGGGLIFKVVLEC